MAFFGWLVVRQQGGVFRIVVINLLVPCLCPPCIHYPPREWGVLVLAEQVKVLIRLLCMPERRDQVFISAHSLTSRTSNCLCLLFGSQEKPRRLKPFSVNKKQDMEGLA